MSIPGMDKIVLENIRMKKELSMIGKRTLKDEIREVQLELELVNSMLCLVAAVMISLCEEWRRPE